LQKHLTKKYQLIKSEVMGSLHLAIFINKECSSHIKNAKAYNVKTGVANVMTNKGAIGISLQFDALTFLFVNSHLTAYQKKVSYRNDDYKRITKGLHMNINYNNYDQSYDYIFWFGDLNYRINGIRSIVDKLIKENQLEVLLANDQLRIEKSKGNAFNTFSEAPITFRPTYKFDVYTKNYISNEASDYSSFTDTYLNKTNYNRIADSMTNTTNPTIEDISSNGSNKMETNYIKMNSHNTNINDDDDDDDDYNNSNNNNNNNNKLLKYESSKEYINYEMEHPVKEIPTLSKLNVYDTSKKSQNPVMDRSNFI